MKQRELELDAEIRTLLQTPFDDDQGIAVVRRGGTAEEPATSLFHPA